MVGFHEDELGDWVAELGCGHPQHVRHKPPFFSRPWVTTPEGREGMLGHPLDCVRCDRLELPEGLEAYKQTRVFDESSVPEALLGQHTTKAGVWGVIRVLSGRLRYHLDGLDGRVLQLDPDRPGVVPPEMRHHVEPDGPVRFLVEFQRRPRVPG
jgi:tellurite resistance-related uncharacterized protein